MEHYSRRYILKTSLWTFGALCFDLSRVVASAIEPKNATAGRLNWDEFVHKLELTARAQHNALWDKDSYVGSVARLLGRLDPLDPALQLMTSQHRNQGFVKPDFAELLKTTDVQISLITFGKGEWLPHHDHPSMTGVLTCATGALLVDSYDRVQAPELAGPSTIVLKKLESNVITPGNISTLTDKRRNVHSVRALSFTQVIDIFTPPYNSERTSSTGWYRVANRPIQGHEELFIAHPYY